MDHTLWTPLITGIAALITGLGLPHLYRSRYGYLTQKQKSTEQTQTEINNLKLKISQIVTSVDMLIIVIKDEFEGSPNIQTAIERVKEHLHSIDESASK